MKVPLSWLREYVDVTLPVARLAERLTLAGLEVAGVRLFGVPAPEGVRVKAEEQGPVWDRDKFVIAEILEIVPHPDADNLTLPTVSFGGGKTKQLLTGAKNIKVGDKGQKVIVAMAGSKLYDGHAKEKVMRELKPRTVRGFLSDAMVCSQYELGISDDHEGIVILDDDAPVGVPLIDYMGDVVLDIDVLPNMARCLSMIGMAREVAALTGQPLRLPKHTADMQGDAIEGQVTVAIEDPKLSARYAAMLLKGAKIGPAPYWMRRRLLYAGMRPISNVVDVTNYVMLEWGQPLHAFDYDKLKERAGGKAPGIVVRPARAGEVLVTLDGQKRELSPENLVIADGKGAVALAGVMGGQETEVSATTTNILLESAGFDFVSIRRTMRQFDLPSEASMRFSKGVHPDTVLPAAGRAAELMRLHAGATVSKGVADTYPARPEPQVIRLRMSEVRRSLGMDIKAEDATRVLKALEFKVEPAGDGVLTVTAPPHRLDIQEGEADLIEDLARIHGYDKLPATLLAEPLPEQRGNPELEKEERVRDLLAGAGLQEVVTYSLTIPEREAPLGLPPAEYVRLVNPISSERVVMRHSVLASVLEVVANNLKNTDDVRLFEIGYIYLPCEGSVLPEEQSRLAVAMTGHRDPEFWGVPTGTQKAALNFFDLKGTVEALLSDLHVTGATYRPSKAPHLHPGKAAEVVVGNVSLGTLGQLHPRTALAYAKTFDAASMGSREIYVADLDLKALLSLVPERYPYEAVPRFPAALRDIAVIVDDAVTGEQIEQEIRAAGGDLLRGCRLFDLYRGESIAAGKKSLAYALTYQAMDRTLTDKEVDTAHKKIEGRLKHVLKASIRGQE